MARCRALYKEKCDDWLRKSTAKEERSLVALSEPRESEIKKIDRMLKRG